MKYPSATRSSRLAGFLLSLVVSIFSMQALTERDALAQSDNAAGAEALFNEARALFDAGKISQACEKFTESQRLDPSLGTLLNLARCHEHEGKTASAWSGYLATKRAAARDGRDAMAEEAAAKAKALEPRLSYLAVTVTTQVEGLLVSRGEETVAQAVYGSKIPVDPGSYTMTASAPGYESWTEELKVGAGESKEVLIPALLKSVPVVSVVRKEPAEEKPKEEEPAKESETRSAPVLAYVVGGAGILVAGTGLLFGGLTKGAYSDAEEGCPTQFDCDEDSTDARSRAGTFATISTIGVAAGLAGVATGIFLWAIHEDDAKESAWLQPEIGSLKGGAYAQLKGSF